MTLPLHLAGIDIIGSDIDAASIACGRDVLRDRGIDEALLQERELPALDGQYDIIVASEVLEHLDDTAVEELLREIADKLRPGGKVLVTVPNGYGWYELEVFVWTRTGLGWLINRAGIGFLLRRMRLLFVSGATWSSVPNTLSSGPHLQRFTLRGLEARLARAGFDVTEARGSVLVAGPFSELVFGGARSVQNVNARLAERFPRVSAGFYVAATLRGPT